MKLGKTLTIDELVALVLKGVSVRNGVLFVKLASSVVKNAVLMEKEGIIQALNKRVGEDVVKDIIVS